MTKRTFKTLSAAVKEIMLVQSYLNINLEMCLSLNNLKRKIQSKPRSICIRNYSHSAVSKCNFNSGHRWENVIRIRCMCSCLCMCGQISVYKLANSVRQYTGYYRIVAPLIQASIALEFFYFHLSDCGLPVTLLIKRWVGFANLTSRKKNYNYLLYSLLYKRYLFLILCSTWIRIVKS